jgi:predicted PurR-regulated permease PerM
MVAYGIFAISMVDNLIKPYIISRGSKLSFIVMFIGVLGGVVAFGFIGVFLGPTLLAVGYSLTHDILTRQRSTDWPDGTTASPSPAHTPDNPETVN